MPASTRQATPGPSTILQPHTTQSVNSRKRAATETSLEDRDTKKPRADAPSIANVNGAKDKKKKKRKKKKRTSVVRQDPAIELRRVRSSSRSVAPPSATSTIVRPLATPNAELVAFAATGTSNRGTEEPEEPVLSSSDKGKGKAKSDSPFPSPSPQPRATSSLSPSNLIMPDSSSQASELARLKAQLAEQSILLKRHQTHLNHHQQSLTCQICLDLMHKPYALTPCGHITCYGCLVRWFTAPQNPRQQQNGNAADPAEPQQDSIEQILNSAAVRNGTFMRRRKTCPICRAVVQDRPIEMWGIKSMVAALVRSELTDLPAPAAEVDPPPAVAGQSANNGRDNNDPWRNVFRRVGARNNFGAYMYDHMLPVPPPMNQAPGGAGPNGGEADRAQMGWFDMEDGGIYRCIDCYHEIWEGVCTSCNRRYPGHNHLDDDDDVEFDVSDDDDDDDGYDGHFRGGIGRFMEAIMNDDDGLDDDGDGDLDLGLLDEDIEEEMEAHEEVLRQLRNAEEQHGRWPNYDREVVAMLDELVGEDDEDGEEDEGPDSDGQPWYDWPVRQHQPAGGARIEEVHDDDSGAEEEDSQYGGSFIDDQAEEEHDHEPAGSDEGGSEDEVEFVRSPPQNNIQRLARPLVVVESSDDEDESEEEEPRARIRRLARGIRPQPRVPRRTRRARYVEVSDEDEDGSVINLTDDGEPEAAGNDSGLDHVSEEERVMTRAGRPYRRAVYHDWDD